MVSQLPTGVLVAFVGVLLLLGGSIQVPLLVAQFAFSPHQFVTHRWVFPASVAFAIVAMAAGVSGARYSHRDRIADRDCRPLVIPPID